MRYYGKDLDVAAADFAKDSPEILMDRQACCGARARSLTALGGYSARDDVLESVAEMNAIGRALFLQIQTAPTYADYI